MFTKQWLCLVLGVFCAVVITRGQQGGQVLKYDLPMVSKGEFRASAAIVDVLVHQADVYVVSDRSGCYFFPDGQMSGSRELVIPVDRRDVFHKLFEYEGVVSTLENTRYLIPLNRDDAPLKSYASDFFSKNFAPSCYAMDRRGRVMLGTPADGMFIFPMSLDGNYTALPRQISMARGELPSNQVNALYEDSKGLVWIGTGSGIAVMQADSVRNISKAITTVPAQWWKRLFQPVKEIRPAFNVPVKAIAPWGDCMLLLSDNAVYKITARPDTLAQIAQFPLGLAAPLQEVADFKVDIDGGVWIAAEQLLYFDLNTRQLTDVGKTHQIKSRRFLALEEDLLHSCWWIGTESNGLYKLVIDPNYPTARSVQNGW